MLIQLWLRFREIRRQTRSSAFSFYFSLGAAGISFIFTPVFVSASAGSYRDLYQKKIGQVEIISHTVLNVDNEHPFFVHVDLKNIAAVSLPFNLTPVQSSFCGLKSETKFSIAPAGVKSVLLRCEFDRAVRSEAEAPVVSLTIRSPAFRSGSFRILIFFKVLRLDHYEPRLPGTGCAEFQQHCGPGPLPKINVCFISEFRANEIAHYFNPFFTADARKNCPDGFEVYEEKNFFGVINRLKAIRKSRCAVVDKLEIIDHGTAGDLQFFSLKDDPHPRTWRSDANGGITWLKNQIKQRLVGKDPVEPKTKEQGPNASPQTKFDYLAMPRPEWTRLSQLIGHRSLALQKFHNSFSELSCVFSNNPTLILGGCNIANQCDGLMTMAQMARKLILPAGAERSRGSIIAANSRTVPHGFWLSRPLKSRTYTDSWDARETELVLDNDYDEIRWNTLRLKHASQAEGLFAEVCKNECDHTVGLVRQFDAEFSSECPEFEMKDELRYWLDAVAQVCSENERELYGNMDKQVAFRTILKVQAGAWTLPEIEPLAYRFAIKTAAGREAYCHRFGHLKN